MCSYDSVSVNVSKKAGYTTAFAALICAYPPRSASFRVTGFTLGIAATLASSALHFYVIEIVVGLACYFPLTPVVWLTLYTFLC